MSYSCHNACYVGTGVVLCILCLCTFSFACPKEKGTKKKRAPSAFLRLRRMASSLKDRNSLRSNSLSFLTGVCLSLFYASKMRTGIEVGFPLRHANRTIPYYNIYLIYIVRTGCFKLYYFRGKKWFCRDCLKRWC